MSNELFVSRIAGRTWVALREEGRAVELRVERPGGRVRAGRVMVGRVSRVVPAIQSAFIDIGEVRDAFLHVSDLWLPGESQTPAVPAPPIQDRLRAGRDLVVQVVRESPEAKGDRVSCHIGLPGRLLVLLPYDGKHGVSRRITDSDERDRLVGCLARVGCGAGFVARTAAAGAGEEALAAEARRLVGIWEALAERARSASVPCVLYEPVADSISMLRDVPDRDLARVVTDDADEYRRLLAWTCEVAPALAPRIELYRGPLPLFEAVGLDSEISAALDTRVQLPSGGFIVIEPTEALVSIDVNTGRSVHGRGIEATVLETNLEAATEVARQLRLRDLGGIVVIDFIDMTSAENGRLVVAAVREALVRDRARSRIFGLSEIGLLQLTRERVRTALHEAVMTACPSCKGKGHVRRTE